MIVMIVGGAMFVALPPLLEMHLQHAPDAG